MSDPIKPDPTEFDVSDLDVTPTELRPPGELRDPRQAQADVDHAALVVIGTRLGNIEDRLGTVEMRLGNIEGMLSQLIVTLKKG